MNHLYEEICFIVNARNVWAKKRNSLRHKLSYARDWKKPQRTIKALEKQYKAHNDKRHKLNKYSLRLKRLLKKTNGRLISDSNAGYKSIVFYTHANSRTWLHKSVSLKRDEIQRLAASYAFNSVIEGQILKPIL